MEPSCPTPLEVPVEGLKLASKEEMSPSKCASKVSEEDFMLSSLEGNKSPRSKIYGDLMYRLLLFGDYLTFFDRDFLLGLECESFRGSCWLETARLCYRSALKNPADAHAWFHIFALVKLFPISERYWPLAILRSNDTIKPLPREISEMTIRSAASQISGNFFRRRMTGIVGRYRKAVMRRLMDSEATKRKFDEAKWCTLGEITSENFTRKDKVLLLVDDVSENINMNVLQTFLKQLNETEGSAVVLNFGQTPAPILRLIDNELDFGIVWTEYHLWPWQLFCSIVGESILLSPSIQRIAISIIKICRKDLLAMILIARALKQDNSLDLWETAPSYLDGEYGIRSLLLKSFQLFWRYGMDTNTKACFKHYATHHIHHWRGIKRHSLVKNWIDFGLVEDYSKGNDIVQQLLDAFLLVTSSGSDDMIRGMNPRIRLIVGDFLQAQRDYSESPKHGELTDLRKWNNSYTVLNLRCRSISELPESPGRPFLMELDLSMNPYLISFPSSFFKHMPLRFLDLSDTGIKHLPESIFDLKTLRILKLKCCKLFMDLPSQIGRLVNLEVLDLDGTEIMCLPAEIKKLTKLTWLSISFYGYCSRNGKPRTMFPENVIKHLTQLNRLSLTINPDDDRWHAVVGAVVSEVAMLKHLENLKLYLPDDGLLGELSRTTLQSLTEFSFNVGKHLRRVLSRIPREVEVEFEQYWTRTLRYVNGEDVPDEIKALLHDTEAFFLDRHFSVKTLSDFGATTLNNLNLLILAECNEFESFTQEDNMEMLLLESLSDLRILNMKNMKNLWNGTVRDGCLRNLRSITLDTCPQLEFVFTVELTGNLRLLEELIVEECSAMKSLVRCEETQGKICGTNDFLLPSLKRLVMHHLWELESISNGLPIGPNLRLISVFDCPKLRQIRSREITNIGIRKIRAESGWWDQLLWENNQMKSQLAQVLLPFEEDSDLTSQ